MANDQKVKIEGVGSVHLKLHNGAVQTLHNVIFAPFANVNIISLGEMTSQGYKFVAQS